MSVGSLMSIIWTPSSALLATIAYVLEPITNVETAYGWLSSSNPFTPSVSASFATMAAGSLMSIIWTPLSPRLKTMAYVLEPITNVSTSVGRLSTSNPFTPSVSESFATMFSGSLMSIIWTPLPLKPATMAYVLEPITNVSTPVAPLSSSNPFTPSVSESFATMFVGSLMSIIWTP